MADSFGLKIGIEGEREFKKSLADINSSFKVLGSEMKLVESQFDKQDDSVEALTARNEVLNKQITAQKDKIETLKKALANAASSFGENDRRTQAWATQLNNAEAQLNTMERELKKNKNAIDSVGDEMDDAKKQTDKFGDELDDAGKQADSNGIKFEGLGSVIKGVAATIGVAIAAVGTAAVAAGKQLIDMSVEGAAFADTVLTNATVTGIATDKLQEYMYAAELVDVSTETLTKSMAKQIKSMKAAQDGTLLSVDAYERLGVEVMNADGSLRDSDTVYWEVIDALGKMENETERDALAMQILGKSAQELNPLITAGAERMAELGEEAHAAGYVIGDEMLNTYGQFDDQIQYLTVGATAAKNALGTLLLPVLTELAGSGVSLLSEFTNAIHDTGGDLNQISDVIGEILPKALDTVMEYVPLIMGIIGSVLSSIGQAIIDNLPEITKSASSIILTLINGLVKSIPQITKATIKLIAALVDGLIKNIPMLVKAASEMVHTISSELAASAPQFIAATVSVIEEIVYTIAESLPLYLTAIVDIITGMADGIVQALPTLLSTVIYLIEQLILSLTESLPGFISAVGYLLQGIITSVLESIPQLITMVATVIPAIVQAILDSIPILINAVIQILTAIVAQLPLIITTIVEMIPEIITNVITAVIGSIPLILDAVIQLVLAVVENLPTIILTIIQAIPDLIGSIIEAIINCIPQIISCGVELFTSLITNLPQIIAGIVRAIPQIISGIVDSFGKQMYRIVDIGKNLVKGLWEGIKSLSGWLWDKVSGWAGDLWDGICDFFGIHSPSRKFAQMGQYMSMGLAEGFVSEMKTVERDIEESIPTNFDIDAHARIKNIVYDADPMKAVALSGGDISPAPDPAHPGKDLYEQNMLLRQANQLLQRILEKNDSIVIGDEQIGRANTRYESNRGLVLNEGGFVNAY